MIFNGVKILFNPTKHWPTMFATKNSPIAWLLTASITATVFPAIAVVAGHMGSIVLGYEPQAIAAQRAAVGLISIVLGVFVMAPALTLAVSWALKSAFVSHDMNTAASTAMFFLWPVWFCGLIIMIPPLFSLGPEFGETIWFILGCFAVFRIIKKTAVDKLKIRRRWKNQFIIQVAVVFIVLFAVVPFVPAFLVRSFMGVSGKLTIDKVELITWPVPEIPKW